MKQEVNNFTRCNKCLMDTSAKNFERYEDGSCNFCREFFLNYNSWLENDERILAQKRSDLLNKIKSQGKNKKYDCIIGLSGGVDSCFALVKAVENGLRPLVVHMDNGWNSELAQNNIYNIVEALGVDMITHVIDWDEYRVMMEAFFRASVIDVELLYDNFMLSANYRTANKFGLKYILSGSNFATEGIRMPEGWNWYKFDGKNIRGISRDFGKNSIFSIKPITTFNLAYFTVIKGIKWLPFLDYFDYDKKSAIDTLQGSFNFKPYPYKHYESIFTRFYQGYILPEKFGIDKRKLHLSNLILTGQINRSTGLKTLQDSPYPSQNDLDIDKQYFLKKMGWSESNLINYLATPPVPHEHFPNEKKLLNTIKKFVPKELISKLRNV